MHRRTFSAAMHSADVANSLIVTHCCAIRANCACFFFSVWSAFRRDGQQRPHQHQYIF